MMKRLPSNTSPKNATKKMAMPASAVRSERLSPIGVMFCQARLAIHVSRRQCAKVALIEIRLAYGRFSLGYRVEIITIVSDQEFHATCWLRFLQELLKDRLTFSGNQAPSDHHVRGRNLLQQVQKLGANTWPTSQLVDLHR